MDPRHAHEFEPNRKGLCKRIVGVEMCHKPESAAVHQRFVAELLTIEDLESLADEATRQNRSLACLIGAMTDGEPIAWMEGESDGVVD